MLPSTSSRLRQGPTHVTDTGRCPTPCPNPTEVARLGQLSLCCSRSGTSPSSWACSVLSPALWLSCTAVCAATELSVCCCQDLSDLRTTSVLCPDRRGEPVVTLGQFVTDFAEKQELAGGLVNISQNPCRMCGCASTHCTQDDESQLPW